MKHQELLQSLKYYIFYIITRYIFGTSVFNLFKGNPIFFSLNLFFLYFTQSQFLISFCDIQNTL